MFIEYKEYFIKDDIFGITKLSYISEIHQIPGEQKEVTVIYHTPFLNSQEKRKKKEKIEEALYDVLIKYQT